MKYSLQKRISAFVLAFALVMTTAFNSIGATTKADAAAKVKALYLTSKTATLTVGQTGTAKFGVRATKATKAMAKVTVKSSDTSVVKVGKITTKAAKKTAKAAKKSLSTVKYSALKAGTATITITTKKKTKKTKKFKVTVTAKSTEAPASTAATTQASADATTALPADVKVESLLLDKSAATVMEGQTVTLTATKTPAAAQAAVTWTSSNEKVATVKDGVVTGVASGEAIITAKADDKTATAKITVTKKEIVATLVDAKQATAKSVTIAFDIPEAKDVVAKNDVKITNVSSNALAAIDNLTFDATGKIATAKLTSTLSDKASYSVEYKGVTKTFIASVGDVASVSIVTEFAELNTPTPIEFKLLDASGMDVTDTIAVDSRVTVTETGANSSSLTPSSKATITLGNVGDKAEVTVTYDKGDGKSDLVSITKAITCIAASAKVGTGIFYANPAAADIDHNSDCVKFYNGLKSNIVNVVAGGAPAHVYFYADASADGAISYDSYEVEAVDGDVASSTIATYSQGKFCDFEVTGYSKGTTQIKVKATVNNATTEYQIPVNVTETGKINSVTVTDTLKQHITNAVDYNYYDVLTAEASFTGGTKTDVEYKWEVTTTDLKDVNGDFIAPGDFIVGADNEKSVKITAAGVRVLNATKKINVKVTATDANLNSVSRTFDVNIDALSDDFWNGNAAASIKYDLEATNTTYKLSSLSDTLPTYKIKATSNNKFAGYVWKDGTNGFVIGGTKHASQNTYEANSGTDVDASFKLDNLTLSVSGADPLKVNGNLVSALNGANVTSATLDPRGNVANVVVDFVAASRCSFYAGDVKVSFTFDCGTKTNQKLEKTIKFTNDFAKPDVLANLKTVKSTELYNIYKSKYDLNNNDGHGTVADAYVKYDTTGPGYVQVTNGTNSTIAVLSTNALTGATDVTYIVPCNGGKITFE